MAPQTHRPALEVRLQSRFSEPANAKEPSTPTAVADVPTGLSPVHNSVPSANETTPNVAIAKPVKSSAASASIGDVQPVVKEISEDGPVPTTEIHPAKPSTKSHSDTPPPKVSRLRRDAKRVPKPRSRPKTLTAARPPRTVSLSPGNQLRTARSGTSCERGNLSASWDRHRDNGRSVARPFSNGHRYHRPQRYPISRPAGASPSASADATQPADASTPLSTQASKQIKSSVLALLPPRLKYPRLARKRGWSVTVHVQVTLSDGGRVSNTTVVRSSGHRLLDQAALERLNGVRMLSTTGERHAPPTLELPVVYELTGY
jgi:protein TonB